MPIGVYDRTKSKPRPRCSDETKQKISAAKKGRPCPEWQKKFLSEIRKGKPLPPGATEKAAAANTGKKISDEKRRHLQEAQQRWFSKPENRVRHGLKYKGEKSVLWKGGITPERRLLRRSIEFSLWRDRVFERDNWTCQRCGLRGGRLHPHHIMSFADHPKLRFETNNGETLCVDCHGAEHGMKFRKESHHGGRH